MTLIPRRTIASQIADDLRAEIARGTWQEWLPGERSLHDTLQASRNAIRSAIQQLKAEGLVESVPGIGNRLCKNVSHLPEATRITNIGALIPGPIGSLRPLNALMIDELREHFIAAGARLHVHAAPQCYRANAVASLDRLVATNHYDAWIIWHASRKMQAWFEARSIRTLILGSAHEGITLPSLGVDFAAVCRHATGVLMRQGHRRIALLNRSMKSAGDIDGETGFMEAIATSSHPGVSMKILYHHDSLDSVTQAIDTLLAMKSRPTAIIVCHSFAYVAAASVLALRGCRIPQDISLISRDDDPFLEFIAPEPARYAASPRSIAKKALALALKLATSTENLRHDNPIIPRFLPGASVGPPAA